MANDGPIPRPRPGARNPVLSSRLRVQVPVSLPASSCGVSFCACAAVPATIIAITAANAARCVCMLLILIPRAQKKRVGNIAHPLFKCTKMRLELETQLELDEALVVAVGAV